jgi:hypothetical protein
MRKSEVFNIYENSSDKKKEEFAHSITSKAEVHSLIEKREIDDSWINIIEETIRYIENIILNPKKFIVNEEEVIAIEKAKRVTVDSIIHLTQNTNYIQDYNPKTGDVMPSRILNINKEETFEMYENRFIYSLITNLRRFIDVKETALLKKPVNKVTKKVNYQGTSKVGNEDITINVDLMTDHTESKEEEFNDLKSRLEKIKIVLNGITSSEFYTALQKARVAPVRSPIKRTNVILKNPNFQKAVTLWDFIERYRDSDVDIKEDNVYSNVGNYKNNLDEISLINYLVLNNFTGEEKEETEFNKFYITKLVNDFVDKNTLMTETEFNKLIRKEYKSALRKKIRRQKEIEKIIKAAVMKNKNNNKKALKAL